jgi:hypothetical protein
MLDLNLTLAILHHFFVFALFGVLFTEFVRVRRGMDAATTARVVPVDAWYGILAAFILIVGFSRAIADRRGRRQSTSLSLERSGAVSAAAGFRGGNGSRLRQVLMDDHWILSAEAIGLRNIRRRHGI